VHAPTTGPIIEVIDKFLCIGAFDHTSKVDALLACGIRTVMNVRTRGVWGGCARARDATRRDATRRDETRAREWMDACVQNA
jgi:hypothetical protein